MAQQSPLFGLKLPPGLPLVGSGHHLLRAQASERFGHRSRPAPVPRGLIPGAIKRRMKRIAVIGSGISGLAAAYYLSRKHEVHVFEKDSRVGGHTHTHV